MNLGQALEECKRICVRFAGSRTGLKKEEIQAKLWNELANMSYLLSISSSGIEKKELATINKWLELSLNAETLVSMYGNDTVSDDSFLHKIPETIVMIAEAEKKENPNMGGFLRDARTIYETFKLMGNAMLDCDVANFKYEKMLLNFFTARILKYILTIESRDDLMAGEAPVYSGMCDIEDDMEYTEIKEFAINEKKIKEILDEVDNLTGLTSVKKEIHNMVNLLIVQKMRSKSGFKNVSMSRHLVFSGNPGTGKTTIARKIAQIYMNLGIISTNKLVETDRAGLVSGYMGQTASNVHKIAMDALDGVLFIDEAYTLSSGGVENDYGQEAIDTLLKIMEDYRDRLIVIVAGYTDRMEKFINSNPGLRSRFNNYIHFEDYTVDELCEIFRKFCKEQDYVIAEDAENIMISKIKALKDLQLENFGNARAIRNYFEDVVTNQANRIVGLGFEGIHDSSSLQVLTAEDF